MGCVSSKIFRKDLEQEILFGNAVDCSNHIVSLTSTTYGALKLDKEQPPLPPIKDLVADSRKSHEEPEVINAWELMEDLEEQVPISIQAKKSPNSRGLLRGFADMDTRSPLKFLNQMGSPIRFKRSVGKENKGKVNGIDQGLERLNYSPKMVLKTRNFPEKSFNFSPMLRNSMMGSPINAKCNDLRTDSGIVSSRRRSLSPLFSPILRNSMRGSPVNSKCDDLRTDSGNFSSRRRNLSPLYEPEHMTSFEKEISEEEEHVKKMVSATPTTRKARDSETILELFEKICPRGGENAVVIYTTTLRGIRKTFEDCNIVRSIIESHCVMMFERDVSMHSGFKEELRGLMCTKEVKVPLVFVKGRLIGGADEMVKLEEEGKLGILLNGIARAVAGCEGCGGVRFVMCMDCNGSCKLRGEDGKKTVKCGECNENGLIQCPICC